MSKRIRFFVGHLSLSFVVAIIISAIVFFVWYPNPLSKGMGINQLFLMMLVIDVIVGPLLGWMVYKEGKKTLKIDLAVVILIQLLALSYGVYTFAKGRPAWIVYGANQFTVVKNTDIETAGIHVAKPEYQKPGYTGAGYVNLEAPDLTGIQGLANPKQIPRDSMRYPIFYRNFNEQALRGKGNSLSMLEHYNDAAMVKKIRSQYEEADAWLPVSTGHIDMVMLINSKEGKIIKMVDLRPWN